MAETLASLIVKIGADITQYVDQLGKAQRQIGALGSQLESVGARMSAAITLPLVGVGAAALKTAGDFEQNQIAFKTMLGSAERAKSMLGDLQKLAEQSPFELTDTITGARRLLAMGVAAKDTVPTLRSIGQAVSAMGGGADLLQRVTLAIGQMGAKGKVTGDDMRQLTEAGINGWDSLAKAMGKSVPEVQKLSEKGMISASVGISAILSGMDQKFKGSMEAQAATFNGQLSMLKDRMTLTLNEIGKALLPVAMQVLGALQPALDQTVKLAQAFGSLPAPVQTGVVALLAFVAAAGPVILISGAMASAIAGILKTFALFGGGAGIVAGVTASLGTLAIAVGVVAAAFAAWKLGTWAAQNIDPAKRSIGLLIESMTGITFRSLTDAGSESAKWAAETERNVQKMAATMKTYGVTVERGSMTTQQYAAALMDAAKVSESTRVADEARKVSTNQLADAVEKSTKKHKEFSETVLKAQLERIAALKREGDTAALTAQKLAVFYAQMIDGAEAAKDLADGLKLAVPVLVNLEGAYQALGVVSAASLERTAQIAIDSYKTILASGVATTRDLLAAWIQMEEAIQSAAMARGETVLAVDRITLDESKRRLDELNGKATTTAAKVGQQTSKAMQAVSTVVTDLSRGIADAIIHAKSLGDVFKKVADDILTAILRNIIEKGLNKMIEKIGAASGAWGKLGGIIGGGSSSGGGGAVGTATSAGGGIASTVGSVGGAVASAGTTAIVGAVAGVVSAVSGIIGNFQMMAMNKSLDLIEANTRFTQIGIIGPGGMLDRLNTYLPGVVGIQERLVDVRGALFDPVARNLEQINAKIGTGGAGGMTFNFSGVTNPRDMAELVVREMRLAGVRI